MPSFSYIALDKSGQKTSGSLSAGDRGEALRLLEKKGLRPTKLSEQAEAAPKEGPSPKKESRKKSAKPIKPVKVAKSEKPKRRLFQSEDSDDPNAPLKLKKAEVILFTEELSDMLAAGLQLEPALRSMENRQQSGNLQKVSQRVRTLVRDGTPFSKSIQMASPSFGPLYTSMAAAGEASGALDTILKRQAHYLKTLGELHSRVIIAMIYPAFLVIAGIGVACIFVTQLIPQLTQLLTSTPGAEIPLGAKLLISASGFLSQWWWVIILAILILLLSFKAWKDVDANKPTWDRMKLELPLTGQVVKDRFFVQFLETMSNLIGNGLTLLRSLELTKDATQNLHLKDKLGEVIEQVGDGRSLSSSLVRAESFPALLIDMVSVGEQTGQLDTSLAKSAERYDKELNNSLQRVMALIMPAVLIVMALLIGLMAYLMLTAIFQTIQTLSI